MSEIKFLQSCPGLDIATHAPCAIDSGFESVDKLHHRWSWDARWLTPGRKRVYTTIRKQNEQMPQGSDDFSQGSTEWAVGH